MPARQEERTPPGIREGVRSGILASIQRDVELRGGRTARLLVAAGVVGVLGAVGVMLLVARHPFDHHPTWHLTVFGAVWAGLLVVNLSIAFLHVRTPSLPLSRAASVGILGLGLAGICGAMCPDQHFLHWWSRTSLGASLDSAGGPAASALCFGLVTTLFFGGAAALLLLGGRQTPPVRPLLPAAMLVVLLSPGVALQSVGVPPGVLPAWLAGAAAGAWLGVAGGIRVRSLLSAPRTE